MVPIPHPPLEEERSATSPRDLKSLGKGREDLVLHRHPVTHEELLVKIHLREREEAKDDEYAINTELKQTEE